MKDILTDQAQNNVTSKETNLIKQFKNNEAIIETIDKTFLKSPNLNYPMSFDQSINQKSLNERSFTQGLKKIIQPPLNSTINASSFPFRTKVPTKLQNYNDCTKIQIENIESRASIYMEEQVLQQTLQIEAFGQVATDSIKFWKKETEKQMRLAEITQSVIQSKNIFKNQLKISEQKLRKLRMNLIIIENKFNKDQLNQIIIARMYQRKIAQVSCQFEKIFLQLLELERKITNTSFERDVWKNRAKMHDTYQHQKDDKKIATHSTMCPPLALLTGFTAKSLGHGSIEYTHTPTDFSFLLRSTINLDEESLQLAKDVLGHGNKLIEYQPIRYGGIIDRLPLEFKDGLLLNRSNANQLFSRLFAILTNFTK